MSLESGIYAVLPPPEVRADKNVLVAKDVVERLRHTEWQITFQDNRQGVIDFPMMIALLYIMRDLKRQIQEFEAAIDGLDFPTAFQINTDVDEREYMKPAVVRKLLVELARKKGMG